MNIDAAYCCNRTVWSVCHSSEPCKNCWTDQDAIWVEDFGGPKGPCIRWGSKWFLGWKRPITLPIYLCSISLTGSIACNTKRQSFKLLRGQCWGFSPRRVDMLLRWGWKLARRMGPRGPKVSSSVPNFARFSQNLQSLYPVSGCVRC